METEKLRGMRDVLRVRAEIRAAEVDKLADPTVWVRCLDRADADSLYSQLTEAEREKVRFTWLIK